MNKETPFGKTRKAAKQLIVVMATMGGLQIVADAGALATHTPLTLTGSIAMTLAQLGTVSFFVVRLFQTASIEKKARAEKVAA